MGLVTPGAKYEYVLGRFAWGLGLPGDGASELLRGRGHKRYEGALPYEWRPAGNVLRRVTVQYLDVEIPVSYTHLTLPTIYSV